MPIALSISNTAINRVIGTQWNSIQHSWTGSWPYGSYAISLNQPTIILVDNAVKISLSLNISTSIYTGSLTVTPTLIIPPTTITASNIITQYQDLQQQINNQISDQNLRSLVNSVLSSVTWIIYQGQILNASTTRLSDITDIQLNGLPTLTVSVSSNNLNLTVSETITATTQWYKLKSRNYGGNLRLRFESDVNFTSRSIKLTFQLGSYHWNESVNRSATYDATQGIYYLEVQTDQPAGEYGTYGFLYWAFYRGNNEVIRSAMAPSDTYLNTFQEWVQWAVNHGSYGY